MDAFVNHSTFKIQKLGKLGEFIQVKLGTGGMGLEVEIRVPEGDE